MKLFSLFILLFPFVVFGQGSLSLTGRITGLKDGTLVTLTDLNKPTDTVGKAKVSKGVFTLKATLKEPLLVALNLGTGKSVRTFLSNSKVTLTGDIKQLENVKITGSATATDFAAFQNTFDPLFARLRSISEQMQYQAPTDSLNRALTSVRNELQSKVDAFLVDRRSSPVSAFLLVVTMQLSEDYMLTERRLNSLSPAALENMYGIYLKAAIAEIKITAVGSVAPDFTQADTSGVAVSLSSFRGKYVLLDFWASWCGPCRRENPNVVATYNKFKDKNFTVLGVSLDRPGQKDKWLQAIHADNLSWTHVSDLQFWSNTVAVTYKVQTIPQNFLLGPDGKIIAKDLRGPVLEMRLCELLGCN